MTKIASWGPSKQSNYPSPLLSALLRISPQTSGISILDGKISMQLDRSSPSVHKSTTLLLCWTFLHRSEPSPSTHCVSHLSHKLSPVLSKFWSCILQSLKELLSFYHISQIAWYYPKLLQYSLQYLHYLNAKRQVSWVTEDILLKYFDLPACWPWLFQSSQKLLFFFQL